MTIFQLHVLVGLMYIKVSDIFLGVLYIGGINFVIVKKLHVTYLRLFVQLHVSAFVICLS